MAYTWGADPNFTYGEGSSFAPMGWIDSSTGKFMQVLDPQSVQSMGSGPVGTPPPDQSVLQAIAAGNPALAQKIQQQMTSTSQYGEGSAGGNYTGPTNTGVLANLGFAGGNLATPGAGNNRVGGDPNYVDIVPRLRALGLSDNQIMQYAAAAAPNVTNGNIATNYDWASFNQRVLQAAAQANPSLAPHLQTMMPTQQQMQSSQQWAAAQGQQTSQAGNGFMGNYGGFILPALFGGAVLAAGAAAGAGGATAGAGAEDAAITGMSVPGASAGSTGLGLGATTGGGLAAAGGGAAGSGGLAGQQLALADTGTMSDVSPGLLGGAETGGGGGSALDAGMDISGMGGTNGVAAGMTAPGGATAAGGGGGITDWLSKLGSGLTSLGNGMSGTNSGGGSTSTSANPTLPFSNLIGSILSYSQAGQNANQINTLMDRIQNMDQFRTQQPKYFDPLYDAATKGIGNTAYGQSLLKTVMAQDAAKGYNQSGNFVSDALQGLNSGTMDYVKNLTPLALGNNPYPAANTMGTLGLGSLAQTQQQQGQLGSAIGQVANNPGGVISGAGNLVSGAGTLAKTIGSLI